MKPLREYTHTHTGNLLVNRKAKKLALLNILKTDYKHKEGV